MLMEYCDSNQDGNVDSCEIFYCVVMVENEWRMEHCPNYGDLYCDGCPFVTPECEGAWNCPDIVSVTDEILEYMDTNDDGVINMGDYINDDHLDILMAECDYDNDGDVDACELFYCVVHCENAWRDAHCPESPHVICQCPYHVCECPGKWTCNDIEMITSEVMMYLDSNGDAQINL
jgi:hypothetical protein